MSWLQALLPREGRFFDLFDAHAQTICAGARALRLVLDGGDKTAEHCAEVARQEALADDITRDAMHQVRRTFMTPFDRSDIIDLVSSMDDAIDQMHKTVKAITLFEQRSFEPDMVRMGEIIVRAADLTAEATPLLRQMRANAERLNQIAEEIRGLEDESDKIYDAGLAALYRGPAKADAMAFIVGGEIYDHLEKVVDRFEDVANRISGVLIEHL
jgi:predicted phosphate transport protein (TIGR00153 family)